MYLKVPQSYSAYRVLGIDPGLNHTGVSILDVDSTTHVVCAAVAFTLTNDKLVNESGLDWESHSERMIKIYKLRHALAHILSDYRPSIVGCEAPFYNRLRPMAYGALVEVVSHLQQTIIDHNPNIRHVLLAPMTVKKEIGAKAVKNDTVQGKSIVKAAVQLNAELMGALQVPLVSLSEHAIDALAVAYTVLKQGNWK